MADFAERVKSEGIPGGTGGARQQHVRLDGRRNSLAAYFAVLDLPSDADQRAVRRAYYQLARRYHPDVNNSPDSNARMQQINEAYRRIMAQFEKEA